LGLINASLPITGQDISACISSRITVYELLPERSQERCEAHFIFYDDPEFSLCYSRGRFHVGPHDYRTQLVSVKINCWA
jgi:arginyl-tRNA--protein-N-Asp/Glu arginylyltransferase